MDMPDAYYWISSLWILFQMIRELCKWLKRKRPKQKRNRRKSKRRK